MEVYDPKTERDLRENYGSFAGSFAKEPAPPADRPWNEQELWLLDWHTKTGDPRFQDAAMALRAARQPADRPAPGAPDIPALIEQVKERNRAIFDWYERWKDRRDKPDIVALADALTALSASHEALKQERDAMRDVLGMTPKP